MATDKAGDTIRDANRDAFKSLKPKAITFKDSIGGADASDYFRTRLRSSTSVELALTNLRGNANLELLQKNGSLVARSRKKGTADEAINTTVEAGVYYIHVVGTSDRTTYRLRGTGNKEAAGNSFQDATAIQLNPRKTVFKDYVGPADRTDYYQFTTPDDGLKQVKLQLAGLKSNATLTLFDEAENRLAISKQKGTAKELINRTLEPDSTYFIQVAIAGRRTPGTPYKLVGKLGNVVDRAGDTRDDAAKLVTLPAFSDSFSPLDTELLNIGDTDVYRFVGPDEPTIVDLRLSGLSVDADLFLYEEGNPNPIGVSDEPGTSNEAISDVILTPGTTYYAEIKAFNSSQYTNFTLSAKTKTGIIDLAGNTPELARNIDEDPAWQAGNPGVIQGPLDPSQYSDAVGNFDSDDYYSFTLNEASFLSLDFDISRGNANVQLLDNDGTSVLESVAGTATTDPKIEGVFNSGTYYIRVSPSGGTNASAFYQLNLRGESVELSPAFIKDLRVGSESSAVPGRMAEIGGLLYFAADDGNGIQLWRTDGTAIDGSLTTKQNDGTEKLTNEAFTSLSNLTVANIGGTDILFFTARTAATGEELWRWDAVNGASLVKDIVPGDDSPGIGEDIIAVGNRIYFSAIGQGTGGTDIELWYSDGTADGTQSLDIFPGTDSGSFPDNLTKIGNTLYFTALNEFSEDRIYTIETSGGNVTAVEIAGQGSLTNPRNLTNVNGTLYFTANGSIGGNPSRGNEIWRLSSTTGQIEAVADIVAGTGGALTINELTVLGNSLFFTANANDGAGEELWEMTINPTTGATSVAIVADLNTTAANVGSIPRQLTVADGKLYFIADDGVNGQGLWRYNPVAAPADRLALVEFNDGGTLKAVAATTGDVFLNTAPGSLIAVGDFLYFKANRTATGSELWRINPLLDGIAEELDLAQGDVSSSPTDFTEVNGRLFFRATDGAATEESVGNELWVVGLPNTNNL